MLLIKEIVNCNCLDVEKGQENNDRSVRLYQKPQKMLWKKDKEYSKSIKLQEKQEKDRAEKVKVPNELQLRNRKGLYIKKIIL